MGDDKTTDALTTLFVGRVCKMCGLCEAVDNPDFCTLFCTANTMKFFKDIVVTASMIRVSEPDKFERIQSFEGFCALHCHICPFKGPDCKELMHRVQCYEHFLNQSATTTPETIDRADIYAKWSGVDLDVIPQLQKNPDRVKKSVRKRIIKKAGKAKKDATRIIDGQQRENHKKNKKAKTKLRKKNEKSKKKEVSTTFFCNDDAEWREQINKYLEIIIPNENNNRQSDKAAEPAARGK